VTYFKQRPRGGGNQLPCPMLLVGSWDARWPGHVRSGGRSARSSVAGTGMYEVRLGPLVRSSQSAKPSTNIASKASQTVQAELDSSHSSPVISHGSLIATREACCLVLSATSSHSTGHPTPNQLFLSSIISPAASTSLPAISLIRLPSACYDEFLCQIRAY
jgi:hypothetical protein